MKLSLPLIAICCLFIFSCKKERGTNAMLAKATFAYQFNIADPFSVQTTTVSSNPVDAIKGKVLATVSVKYLSALFYDSTSTLIKRIDQTSSDASFGNINVQLPLGTVHAFFIATDNNSYKIGLRKENTALLSVYPNGYPALAYGQDQQDLASQQPSNFTPLTSELFTSHIDLLIKASASQSITLNRAVSEITVVLDDYPAPTSFYFGQYGAYSWLNLVTTTGENAYGFFYNRYAASSAGSFWVWPGANQTFTVSSAPVYIDKITHEATTSGQLKALTIPNNTVAANTQYVLEGYLSTNRPSGFTINVNTGWNTPVKGTFNLHTAAAGN